MPNQPNPAYVLPQDVTAPANFLHLDQVLIDGGPGERAYALGTWNGNPCVLARWNGGQDGPHGFPLIFGNPAWFVLDESLWPTVLAQLEPVNRMNAARYLYGTP